MIRIKKYKIVQYMVQLRMMAQSMDVKDVNKDIEEEY